MQTPPRKNELFCAGNARYMGKKNQKEGKKRNEQSLGELFCFFILETILLGRALKVNPFDQPSVELIKTETKKILF